MKRKLFAALLMVSGLALVSACASIQTGQDHERSVETKIVAIQQNVGDGLKTDALTLDQTQMFLRELKSIRADYAALRDNNVTREQWNRLHKRLDVLDDEVNRTLARISKNIEPRSGDRIIALQRSIDDGRITERLTMTEEREFQSRLDSIRRDHLRITEEGVTATNEEKAAEARRLDSLTTDLNKFM